MTFLSFSRLHEPLMVRQLAMPLKGKEMDTKGFCGFHNMRWLEVVHYLHMEYPTGLGAFA